MLTDEMNKKVRPPFFINRFGWIMPTLVALIALSACAKRQTVPLDVPGISVPAESILKTPTSLPTITYTIQLGAFESSIRAERLVSRLQKEGLDAYFYEDKSGLAKVRFGRFDTDTEARDRAVELKRRGIIDTYYIVRPKDEGRGTQKTSAGDSRKSLGNNLVATARGFIGLPYRWGGASVKKGFDCSGLTMTVYRLNGLDLPRKASSQYKTGQPVARDELKKGDLVFFATNGDNRISHVGIYSGEDKFIHAPGRGKRIRRSSLDNDYYRKHYRGGRRYF